MSQLAKPKKGVAVPKVTARQVGSFEIDLVLRGLPVVLLRRGRPVAALVRLPVGATKNETELSQFIDQLKAMTQWESTEG